MADEIPVVPKAGSILIHTGNIVNWNRLKRRLTQTPTEELSECISSTLAQWAAKGDKNELQFALELECSDGKYLEKLPEEERDTFKLTVKIFLQSLQSEFVNEAIEKVLCELDTNHIETVLLSVPEAHQRIEDIQPLWETLEEWVEKEKVFSLGIADLGTQTLQELYDWAKVKPCLNQVNLAHCCVIPPELTEFAKEHDIQLLTHNDPKEILPAKNFQDLVVANMTARDGDNWQPCWVVRYSVVFKSRGVIKTKGYVVKAARDIKKRK